MFMVHHVLAQGGLTPPGAPAPTMKTLEQVEPRTTVTNLPYTISAPGSYYLTSNLIGVTSQNGITIQSADVTLDLNGFELLGVAGALAGIKVSGTQSGLYIHNGTLRGWGAGGVDGFQAESIHLEKLRALGNTGFGLSGGNVGLFIDCIAISNTTHGIASVGMGLVRGCLAKSNGGWGISSVGPVRECSAQENGYGGIASSTSVIDSDAEYNTGEGILVEFGGQVSGCTVKLNTGNGITASQGSDIADCTVYNNGAVGIAATAKCTIRDCTLFSNGESGIEAGVGSTVRGCTVRQSGDDGILVPNDCLVQNNHCTQNGGAGIRVSSAGNRVDGNSLIYNKQGIWLQGPVNVVIRNTSRYNPGASGSSNYVGTAGNDVGPIGTAATSTSPWANISY